MRRIKGRRPSPAMVIALVALVAAFAGESIADVATKALTKKEKKQTKKIARNKANQAIDQRAPGLSVANAVNATNASNASNAGSVDGKSALSWNRANVAPGFSTTSILGQLGIYEFRMRCVSGGATEMEVRRTDTGGNALYTEVNTTQAATSIGNTFVDLGTTTDGTLSEGFVLNKGTHVVIGNWTINDNGSICSARGGALGS